MGGWENTVDVYEIAYAIRREERKLNYDKSRYFDG